MMNRRDRLDAVRYLSENGAFNFQKGIILCAEKMGISRFTVYNYLKEIKKENS